MRKYLLIAGITIGIFLSANLLMAEDNAENADEALEYTYGSVVSATPQTVVIKEYNYESDEDVQASYVINTETKFNNMVGVQDLAQDDNVDIYYKVVGNQKEAKMITKDETAYESEEADTMEEDSVNELSDNSVEPVSPPINLELPDQADVNETRG